MIYVTQAETEHEKNLQIPLHYEQDAQYKSQ